MSAPRLSLREQRLAFVTGVVLLTGGIVSWVVAPRWQRLAELREQAALTLEKLQRLEALARQRPDIDAAYQGYAALVSSDDPEAAQRRFLDELDLLAQGAQLHLDLKPQPIQAAETLKRVSVEIDVQTTQDALLAFLDQLLTQPALIELERLRISTAVSAEAPLRANLVVTKVLVPPVL